jgi:hypothetical protein
VDYQAYKQSDAFGFWSSFPQSSLLPKMPSDAASNNTTNSEAATAQDPSLRRNTIVSTTGTVHDIHHTANLVIDYRNTFQGTDGNGEKESDSEEESDGEAPGECGLAFAVECTDSGFEKLLSLVDDFEAATVVETVDNVFRDKRCAYPKAATYHYSVEGLRAEWKADLESSTKGAVDDYNATPEGRLFPLTLGGSKVGTGMVMKSQHIPRVIRAAQDARKQRKEARGACESAGSTAA